jgi:hypothetical protein
MDDTSRHPVTATLFISCIIVPMCYYFYWQLDFQWKWDWFDLIFGLRIITYVIPCVRCDFLALRHNFIERPRNVRAEAYEARLRRKQENRESYEYKATLKRLAQNQRGIGR